ncbi:MAG: helix-turn-helix domain-containing protein [Streptococcaceae bacterium]|jgi:hypothetical protein|nr:helix-turn-helix domain-containing protein [Streptococcaceae bacterium]
MKEYFFDSRKNYIYEIIIYCFKNQSKTYSMKEFREHFDISQNILDNILKDIKRLSKKYPMFSIIILSKNFSISFFPAFLINKVYVLLLKETLAYKFLIQIYNKEFKTLEFFAEENFVSTRTAQRQIGQLSELFYSYSLDFTLKRRELLVGDEYRIRHFYLSIFWHFYEEDQQSYLEYKEMFTKFSEIEILDELNLSIGDRKKLFLFFKITLERTKQGYIITSLPLSITEIQNPFIALEDFKQEIFKFFEGKNQMMSELDIAFVYYMFTVIPSYNFEMIDKINYVDSFSNNEYKVLEESIVSEFYKQTNIRLNTREKDFFSLNFIYQMSYFLSFGSASYVAFFTDVQFFLQEEKRRKYIYELVHSIIRKIPLKGRRWSQIFESKSFEFSLYQMFVWLLSNYEHPIRVAFLSKHGKIHRDILTQRLIHISPRPLVIVEQDHSPDVLITDFSYYDDTFINESVFVIGITVKPTEDEWVRVIDFIDSLREEMWKR